jgi:hypothetical protein
MPKPTVASVIRDAKKLAPQVTTEQQAIERLALMSPQVATHARRVGARGGQSAFTVPRASAVYLNAAKAFGRAKKLLVKIVCKDLDYCKHEGDVSKWLDKNLPDIVKKLLSGSPTGIIAKILSLIGVTSVSWAAIVTIVAAWLLKTGLDSLCGCKS